MTVRVALRVSCMPVGTAFEADDVPTASKVSQVPPARRVDVDARAELGGRAQTVTLTTTPLRRTTTTVAGIELAVLRGGRGPRLLVLHDEWGLADAVTWSALASSFDLVVPIHPGFADAPVAPAVKSVGDLALLYRHLLDTEDEPLAVVGASLGGWIALEMAVRCPHHVSRLALISPVGLRFGAPEVRNFTDLFGHGEAELASLLYTDGNRARGVTADSSDEELTAWVRSREATARYGWEPYLHTPGLEHWTRHIDLPVLLVEGDGDRFVRAGYYDDVADALPQPTRRVVAGCGHFPLVEQPDVVASLLKEFAATDAG